MSSMMLLSLRNLAQEKGRLAISVAGVALALFLVLLLEGIFEGTSGQIVTYLEKSDAQVWVMQDGVSNMHMASSVLPAGLEKPIASVQGVKQATPILYASVPIRIGEKRWFSYLVGIRPGSVQGGPWAMEEGSPMPGQSEVVVSEIMARKSRLRLGDAVEILGHNFKVTGLSRETFSMANTVTFISFDDMALLLNAPEAASYFLVKADSIDPSALATAIESSVPHVNAMTTTDFVASDRSMASQMGVEIVQVMSLIGFLVGVLVIGLTMYTSTIRRSREYGIARAIGATTRQLLSAVVVQSLATAFLGFAVALALAYLAKPLTDAFVPEVPLSYPLASMAKIVVVAFGIAVVASLLPGYRVSKVEPAIVFKE
ncbi:MAG: FtsX-like permease family protein [Chloroflexi bacterium]|nr:FtsX-like permease family protein [Chloroflexota bacterium]